MSIARAIRALAKLAPKQIGNVLNGIGGIPEYTASDVCAALAKIKPVGERKWLIQDEIFTESVEKSIIQSYLMGKYCNDSFALVRCHNELATLIDGYNRGKQPVYFEQLQLVAELIIIRLTLDKCKSCKGRGIKRSQTGPINCKSCVGTGRAKPISSRAMARYCDVDENEWRNKKFTTLFNDYLGWLQLNEVFALREVDRQLRDVG